MSPNCYRAWFSFKKAKGTVVSTYIVLCTKVLRLHIGKHLTCQSCQGLFGISAPSGDGSSLPLRIYAVAHAWDVDVKLHASRGAERDSFIHLHSSSECDKEQSDFNSSYILYDLPQYRRLNIIGLDIVHQYVYRQHHRDTITAPSNPLPSHLPT